MEVADPVPVELRAVKNGAKVPVCKVEPLSNPVLEFKEIPLGKVPELRA